MQSRTTIVLLASILGLSATACEKKTDASVDSMSAMASKKTSDSAMAAMPATAPAPAALTDANIVYILDQANAADSARGTLAVMKGMSAAVKGFGKEMAGEHHALRQQGQALATKLGVTPMAPANDMSVADAQTEMDKLNAEAKGKGWDKAYMDYEVTYHKAVLDIATKALGAAQNQELKDLITKAAPILQKHLDHAMAIQSKMAM